MEDEEKDEEEEEEEEEKITQKVGVFSGELLLC